MIAFFARHPTAANLLLLALSVTGLLALPTLQRETFPDFEATQVEVRIVYPGASAEEAEEALCQRMEDAVDGIDDLEEVRCEAREGLGILTAEMVEGGDLPRFLDDIKSDIDAIDDFPELVERPVVRELSRTDRVVTLAVTGPMALPDLKAYAEELKDRMQALGEISQVEVAGFSTHQLRIQVREAALRRYGLSLSDIAERVRRQGVDLPVGLLETGERELLVRFTEQRRTPAELRELVILSAPSGGEIRLGDLAEISDRFELDEEKTLFNGERAALLRVLKTKRQDTLRVRAAVERFVEEARATAPPGVAFVLTEDRSSIVQDRLSLLLRNGAQGLLLVFLAMWLFFQLRFAFWVAAGLPVAFLGALFCMELLGLTINMISMVALLIATGLLMDDAIVISENVATHLHRGKPPLRAAVEGTVQVFPGVVSSFLTSMAVFVPLAFLSGHLGKILQLIPMVLVLVLSVSLIEAFFILPRHLAHAFSHRHLTESAFRQRWDAGLFRFRDWVVGRGVDAAVRHRYWFVGGVIGLFLASLGMVVGGKLKFQPFPDIEGDNIEARLLLPQGTPLWRTEAIVQRILAGLKQVDDSFSPRQPAGERLVRNVQVRFNQNADAGESGPHLATVSADLLTAERREGRLDDMIRQWREAVGELPDVVSLSFKEPVIGPGGLPVEIRLSGRDLDRLKEASLALQGWLARYPGVSDLSDDLRPGKPELRLKLRPGAAALGLDGNTIAGQLRAAFYGTTATEIQVGRESLEIDVRLDPADRADLGDLEGFRIVTADGALVPLAQVAEIVPGRGYSRIQRVNGVRTLTVTGDLDTRLGNASEIVKHTRANFFPTLQQQFPGVRIGVEGQAKESAKTGGSVLRAFGLGLIGIFIILSFQFRSYLEPVVVMSLIPLALVGVIWGHLLMGLSLSMPGVIGFAAISGIVVNDSILLVEFLKLRVSEGMAVVEAAKLAAGERFRAVLLTSLTTIAGLTPLLLERSMQAQVLIPLAVSIVFGLLASTMLVLFVVPAFYSLLDDLGATSLARARREAASQPNAPA